MEETKMKEKVVLAYSGGLDTTVIIPWLKENFDYEVICVCGNWSAGARATRAMNPCAGMPHPKE